MLWNLFRIGLLFSLVFTAFTTQAAVTPDEPGNFITTWNTENSGTSANNRITIPGTGSGYNYEIYWENIASSTMNGTTSAITSSSYTLTFPEPGIYEVQISGAFPRIYFNNGGDKNKLLAVEQWGNIAWTSMDNAFNGCSNLRVLATDAPNLSGVTVSRYMFANAASFNEPVDHWDVSRITDMEGMFLRATTFNQPLSSWNTGNVLTMKLMFQIATAFNQNINSWDVSKVTNMERMFEGADSFNQPLDNWNVSKVTIFSFLFKNNDAFNQNINSWNVASSTSFWHTFAGATAFNQPLNNWDTTGVTSLNRTFSGAVSFNQPLDNWDVSKVTDFSGVFERARSFNQPLNSWNVSKAINMSNFFCEANLFNQPLDTWNVSKVSNFSWFMCETPFNHDISMWNTASATNMQGMFIKSDAFNQDISSWNTSNVTDMSSMFRLATSFDQDLSDWNVSKVTTMFRMFDATSATGSNGTYYSGAGLSQANQDATLSSWAAQPLRSNVPLHIGLKAYSEIGAAALDTLRDTYNWTTTEQYKAEYYPSPDAILFGSSIQSPINSGGVTTEVEIVPDDGCEFIQWSDGHIDNPRQDVLTDNLLVNAELRCPNSSGTSAGTQAERARKYGNDAYAQEIEKKFLAGEPRTLEETLAQVAAIPENMPKQLDPIKDRELIAEMINVLLRLIELLTQLLIGMETEN